MGDAWSPERSFIVGVGVSCSDGPCGHLRRLIVDPEAGKLTHLAVRPEGLEPGRLVPADQVASAGREIRLRCTQDQLVHFEIDEAAPGAGPDPAQGVVGTADATPGGVGGIEQITGYGNLPSPRDRIPAGGVEVRRGEPVYSGEREIGRAEGLTVGPDGRQVTHLVLGTGRFRGRKRVAVPVAHVTDFGDGIQLDLTKAQVRELPVVRLE
jgi:hypothetical protein